MIHFLICIPAFQYSRLLFTHVRWLQPAALTPEENQRMDAAGQIATSLVSTVELTVAGKWQDAHKNIQELCGRNHPCSQHFAHILALVLTGQGRWQQAEYILQKLLRFTKAKHEWYHLSTIASMDSLATVAENQGKWQEAEDMHKGVLEAVQRKLGEEHRDTLSSMNN